MVSGRRSSGPQPEGDTVEHSDDQTSIYSHLGVRAPVMAFSVSGHRDTYGRWCLTLWFRREDQQYPYETMRETYSSLTTNELLDVLGGKLEALLGFAG